MSRSLSFIGDEIRMYWPNPYFGAVPYIHAMQSLSDVKDAYGAESGRSIVRYFLANAKTWRGEHARRIKAELKDMLK